MSKKTDKKHKNRIFSFFGQRHREKTNMQKQKKLTNL